MTAPIEELAAQALSLAPEDGAKLVELLIASFEPKSPTQGAWLKLASLRRDDARAGRVEMVPGDKAMARVRAWLRERFA